MKSTGKSRFSPSARGGLLLAAFTAVLASGACSDGTGPPPPARMESVAGDDQPGFASNPLDEHLAVRVLDASDNPVQGTKVTWSVTSGGGSVTPEQSQSDQNGVARTSWTLGPDEGIQQVTATIAGINAITFTATATVLGPTCDGDPLDLPVGGSALLVGTQASELCVKGGAAVREFVAVAYNTTRSTATSISFNLTATGTVIVAGEPLAQRDVLAVPAAQPGGDSDFHMRLRERERDELAPLVIDRGAGSAAELMEPRLSLANPAVGEIFTLNAQANSSCTDAINVTARVTAISEQAIVMADISNPAGGFTNAEYMSIARTFDTLVYPLDVQHFGEPSDIDRNGKVVLLYTKEVNKLTTGGSINGYVAGFFFARDLFPKRGNSKLSECPTSNVSEMFYLMVPDPQGTINGNIREKDFVRRRTISTLAHEFEHLINSSRRLFVNTTAKFPESAWLDEGLAHAAEELLFMRAAGLAPGQNISGNTIAATATRATAFNDYQVENIQRVLDHLRNTDFNTPFQRITDLATRGAAYWFLRYSVDRIPGSQVSTWKALVNSPDTGFKNVETVINADPMHWARDWSVSLYADDEVLGIPQKFTVDSWNLRSVIASLEPPTNYPLRPPLQLSGVPRSGAVTGGGSQFFRFASPIGGQSRMSVTQTNGAPLPDVFSILVMRTK